MKEKNSSAIIVKKEQSNKEVKNVRKVHSEKKDKNEEKVPKINILFPQAVRADSSSIKSSLAKGAGLSKPINIEKEISASKSTQSKRKVVTVKSNTKKRESSSSMPTFSASVVRNSLDRLSIGDEHNISLCSDRKTNSSKPIHSTNSRIVVSTSTSKPSYQKSTEASASFAKKQTKIPHAVPLRSRSR